MFNLGSLAVYTDALTITTKKGATLDIGSLDDLNAAGTAVDMGLTVSGPKDVTISGWDDSYTGTITATNVENLTITGYEGAIVIGNGTENVTVTGGVDVSLASDADDLVTVDLTTKLYDDPNVAATNTNKAKVSYGGNTQVNSLSFSSANLTTIKLGGYWDNITSTDNANVTSIDIDATIGTLTVDNNDNLTSFDVTGSEINNVVFQNNSGIETVEFDHTTELNYVGAAADDKDVTVSIVDNEGMTSLTWGANYVQSLTVTGNDKLATIDFTGLAAASTGTTATIALNVRDNDLTSDTATDIVDGLTTQYEIDGSVAATGANNDALDLGLYAGDGGMSTLKPYLELALADADATGNVHFDTVTTHTIDTAAIISGETAGAQNSGNAATFEGTVANGGANSVATANWVGLLWYNVASTYSSSNPTSQSIQKQKRAWVIDVNDTGITASTTMSLKISGVEVLESTTAPGTFPTTGFLPTDIDNLDLLINQLKSSAAVSRAASLGATLDVYHGANSAMPAVTFRASSDSGTNGEAYTNAGIAALYGGDGTLTSNVTTYDLFTLTIGGRSVTASPVISSGTSVTGNAAADAVGLALAQAWNAQFGASNGASPTLSFWSTISSNTNDRAWNATALKDENSGSRAYGQTISISHDKASTTEASLATAGLITNTFMDWVIGTDDASLSASDNKASKVDVILSLEETVGSDNVLAIGSSASAGTTFALAAGTISFVELTTSKTATGDLSTTLSSDIFEDDAGIYGSIFGGGEGDVRDSEDASEGLLVETGSQRVLFTRIHWLED
jgi:hypothetical protein